MSEPATMHQIFSILADRHSLNILKMAYFGFKASGASYGGTLSKKQFYVRLRRLRDAGLIEKRDSFYKTTTLGSLLYNGQIKTMEDILTNYWNLKAIDILKARQDFPSHQKETVINEILQNSNLKKIVNGTHLSGFNIIKDFNSLINEVLKLIDNAEQISVENRINAILRVPPNKKTFELINSIIRSPRFDLRKGNVPISFLVIDGIQVIYETANYMNPEQFTIAISNYDDPYLAQQFITYFKLLSKDATVPRLLASIRG